MSWRTHKNTGKRDNKRGAKKSDSAKHAIVGKSREGQLVILEQQQKEVSCENRIAAAQATSEARRAEREGQRRQNCQNGCWSWLTNWEEIKTAIDQCFDDISNSINSSIGGAKESTGNRSLVRLTERP